MSLPFAEFAVTELSVSGWSVPMQAVDPAALTDAPRTVRAGVSFASTIVFGGATLYWFGGTLDEAVTASTESPLLSLLYGVLAYGFAFFAVGYTYSQLARIGAASPLFSSVLVAALAVFVLSLTGYGFAVVGAWAGEAFGLSSPWPGLVGAATLGAAVWLLAPFAVGLVCWVVLAAWGLGGPTRRWVHESEARPNAE
ncbi:hypothetical protein [Halogeometricum limi]|uniref:Uncharacterized protein n=1 Tax=Halogeometricum limi TaxID=555875 RepID=A0A1I6IFH9_9EURY|nr:hypothetical protein [Halogeometricum limi]SFR65458.1 hypothetical protein SAMN04488124_3192 [Halogeometricum limi]